MKLWKAKFPERLKMLVWRIGANAIPTKANLCVRLPNIDPTCTLCNATKETSTHIFLEFPCARALWASACWGFRFDATTFSSLEDFIKLIMKPPSSFVLAQEQWTVSLNMALVLDEI